jgi:ribonucleoside-diphosphate reductase 1 beta chain (ribonucleotide reductase 1) (B2 protein) (R2 protein)
MSNEVEMNTAHTVTSSAQEVEQFKLNMQRYRTFDLNKNDQLQEPMFFGQPVNVARYDQQKYPIFDKLTEKQLSFFWRPEEIDISKDRIDFKNLPEHEKHIFISNLKFQTILDSIQGRAPVTAFLNLVSIPELECWIIKWSEQEALHSRSYTHIIRGVFDDPTPVFDDIVVNPEIRKRAIDIGNYYDDLIEMGMWHNLLGVGEWEIKDKHTGKLKTIKVTMRELKKRLYLAMLCVNILEAIRFYVSFACSFAFAERELMEGNAKIIKLIARRHSCGF